MSKKKMFNSFCKATGKLCVDLITVGGFILVILFAIDFYNDRYVNSYSITNDANSIKCYVREYPLSPTMYCWPINPSDQQRG